MSVIVKAAVRLSPTQKLSRRVGEPSSGVVCDESDVEGQAGPGPTPSRSLDGRTASRFAAADRAPGRVLSRPRRSPSHLTYQMSGRGSGLPERAVARTADERKGRRKAQRGQRDRERRTGLCRGSAVWSACLSPLALTQGSV
ncbi:hypothetical protein SRHO_G00015400 [Serrasalmus rhombeus]